jgi:hypothetical protein
MIHADTKLIPQGASVRVRAAFSFKVNDRGRVIKFTTSDRLWIANTQVDQRQTGTLEVCRVTQPMGLGYRFTLDQFGELFDVIDQSHEDPTNS